MAKKIDEKLCTYCKNCGKRQISYGPDGQQIDSHDFEPHVCTDMGFPCGLPYKPKLKHNLLGDKYSKKKE